MQNSGSKKNWQLYALSLAMPEVKKKRKEKEKRKGKTQQICKFNKTFESFCADKYSILNFFWLVSRLFGKKLQENAYITQEICQNLAHNSISLNYRECP